MKHLTWLKPYLFIVPAGVVILVFFIIPVAITVAMGFTSMDFRFRWDWIGFGNYIHMAKDFLIPRIVTNTVVYVVGTLAVFNVTFGLMLALLTSYIGPKQGLFFKTVWLLPRFTPPVVYALLWLWILSPGQEGLLNTGLSLFSLERVDWIVRHPWAVIIVTNGFIGASLGMVIFAAALDSIPPDYLRAAKVDGSSWFQQIRYIMLPMIRWPLMFITAYQTLSLLTSYEYILIITGGRPYHGSEVWSLFAYFQAFGSYSGSSKFGYGAALASVLVVIGLGASVVYWWAFKFKRMMSEPKIEIN